MRPPLKERLDWDLIKHEAAIFNLDPILVAAIIGVESDGDPYRNRIESADRKRNNPERFAKLSNIDIPTEAANQIMSWGLMQIMGTTARDIGFQKSLLMLIEPEYGIEWGCKYLAMQMKDCDGNVQDAISAYNRGTMAKQASGDYKNQGYVTKVLNIMKELK